MKHLLRIVPMLALGACVSGTTGEPAAQITPIENPVPAVAVPEAVELPPPPPDPARLTGLNPGEVLALLGEPTLVRRDANVQMMLFENGDCVFEIIFYEPSPDEHFKATDTSARTTSGTDIDQGKCLADILPNGQWLDTNE